MNDEQFEKAINKIWLFSPSMADQLSARDSAQREALARVEAAYANRLRNVKQLESERDTAQAQLAECFAAHTACAEELRAFHAAKPWLVEQQLAEAVGLLRELDEQWNAHDGEKQFGKLMHSVESFLARHAQAEQQEPTAKAQYSDVISDGGMDPRDRPLQEAQGAQAVDDGYAPSPEERAADLAIRDRVEGRAALATQSAAIKLPERQPSDQKDDFKRGCAHGFNACLIAVSQLNAVRGAEHDQ